MSLAPRGRHEPCNLYEFLNCRYSDHKIWTAHLWTQGPLLQRCLTDAAGIAAADLAALMQPMFEGLAHLAERLETAQVTLFGTCFEIPQLCVRPVVTVLVCLVLGRLRRNTWLRGWGSFTDVAGRHIS